MPKKVCLGHSSPVLQQRASSPPVLGGPVKQQAAHSDLMANNQITESHMISPQQSIGVCVFLEQTEGAESLFS